MTAPDATEAERADEAAAYILAALLRGRLASGIDPALVAARLIATLREHGWRPIPRPQLPGQTPGAGAPPSADYLAAADRIRNQPKENR